MTTLDPSLDLQYRLTYRGVGREGELLGGARLVL